MTTAASLRRVNLIECLKEDAAAADDPPPGSEAWPDAAVTAYYRAGPWPPPPPAAFAAWFPAAARAPPPPAAPPSLLVVAFPCAGSAEDMYSSEGSGPRRAPSPLLTWLAGVGGRLLAVQLPGRAARRGEPPPASAAAVAGALLPLIAPLIVGGGGGGGGRPHTPWAVVGHSLGAWLAFELAAAAAAAGLPSPLRLLVSAMPAPCLPEGARPWTRQAGLDAAGLRRECGAWGISDAVFEPGVWAEYEGLLRADFRLFDEYVWRAPPPLACPVTAFYGDADTRVTEAMVAAWAGVTAGDTRVARVGGPHLWPLQRGPKTAWLAEVVADLARDVERNSMI